MHIELYKIRGFDKKGNTSETHIFDITRQKYKLYINKLVLENCLVSYYENTSLFFKFKIFHIKICSLFNIIIILN